MGSAPEKIKLHRQSGILELQIGAHNYRLAAELLRVHSPSAEVRGHGPGQEVLVFGKQQVLVDKLEATGNYGLRIHFDDGHDSGIFTWSYLASLGQNQQQLMVEYEQALHLAGRTRQPDTEVVKLLDPGKH